MSCVSPWAVVSGTQRAFKPLCVGVERCFGGRGDSGLGLIRLVLLWGRGHYLLIEAVQKEMKFDMLYSSNLVLHFHKVRGLT